MGFDLESINAPRERWLPLKGPLEGVEILVRYASPVEGDKFRRLLLGKRIYQQSAIGVIETVDGRHYDYLVEFCKFYVVDWKGVTRAGLAEPYSADALAKVMGAVKSALDTITRAVYAEADFFSPSESKQS